MSVQRDRKVEIRPETASEFERLLAKPKGKPEVLQPEVVTPEEDAAWGIPPKLGRLLALQVLEIERRALLDAKPQRPPNYYPVPGARPVRETPKAYLVEIKNQDYWFPKSHSMVLDEEFLADDWIVLEKRGELSAQTTYEAEQRVRRSETRPRRACRICGRTDCGWCP